ncbi:hypothetical protein GCM10009838_07020 [Catenulispora subtropica]|uniref:Uncharacterized protein n=1 Tax=Catenulispora subtropica TaxID=450798 RepID=A0ABP5C0Z2_9ACTN
MRPRRGGTFVEQGLQDGKFFASLQHPPNIAAQTHDPGPDAPGADPAMSNVPGYP